MFHSIVYPRPVKQQGIRIRPKPTIIKITITQEQLAKVQALSKPGRGWAQNHTRNSRVKQIIGYSVCCLCSNLPSLQLQFKEQGITVLENYCLNCINQVYERNREKDSELAEQYHCTVNSTTP